MHDPLAAETMPEEHRIVNVDQTIDAESSRVQRPASGDAHKPEAIATVSMPGWDPAQTFQEQLMSLGSPKLLNWAPKYLQHQRLTDLWQGSKFHS